MKTNAYSAYETKKEQIMCFSKLIFDDVKKQYCIRLFFSL